MSDLMLKKEIRQFIRTSGLEVSSKMICPIVKLVNMKYKGIDNSRVRNIASNIISDYRA